MTQASNAVEAVALAAAVAEHADDLRVLLAGLLEFELALGLLVLILAAPPVLAALALILRHDLRVAASSASCEGDARVCKGSSCVRIAASCVHRRGGVVASRSDARYQAPVERQLYARSAKLDRPPTQRVDVARAKGGWL